MNKKSIENRIKTAKERNSSFGGGIAVKDYYWRIGAVCYALVLFILNFVRTFNDNFWTDECFSINLAKMSFIEMINATAGDVHPPMYYIVLQIICRIGGFNKVSYYLSSLIPYGIILILSLTIIWKKFGKGTAIIMVSFASLLPTAVTYNLEVRMYSLAMLFVFLSFYFLYNILTENRIWDYAGFILFSLGAAYTHYYALISVAFFYVALLVKGVLERKKYLAKVIISSVITVVGYLPWFFILLKTFERTSSNYWITFIPKFTGCILYLFTNSYYIIFALYVLILFVGTFIYLSYESGILKFLYFKEKKPVFSFDIKDFKFNDTIFWILAGYLSIFGTITVGISVSKIFRPMFLYRYVVPVSIVAWLIFSVSISKLRFRKIYVAFMTIFIIISCIPFYKTKYEKEKNQYETLKLTLNATEQLIGTSDMILTNSENLNWIVLDYYYPNISHQLIDLSDFPVLDENGHYWLFLEEELNENIANDIKSRGYKCKNILSNGDLGTFEVYIYEVVNS